MSPPPDKQRPDAPAETPAVARPSHQQKTKPTPRESAPVTDRSPGNRNADARNADRAPSTTPAPRSGGLGRKTPPSRRVSSDSNQSRARVSCYANRFELIGLLGVGGMGSVYRVRDLLLGEEVALKILRRDFANSPEAVARFRREVRLARRISHPNVVRVFDVGQIGDEHYYTMECIIGDVVSALISPKRPMDPRRATKVAMHVASGLAAAHRAGVVHRDIKPDNILLSNDGRAVIMDFGVAIASDAPAVTAIPALATGTPLYMAPEQIEGQALNERTDLFALGLVLFEMLTGSLPWEAEPQGQVGLARLTVTPPPPRSIKPGIPESLSSLNLKLLARDPRDRPPNADLVARMLESCLEELVAGAFATEASARRDNGQPPSPPPAMLAAGAPHTRSVAVLPVRNLGSPENQYMADALSDALTQGLVGHPGIRVASPPPPSADQKDPPIVQGSRAGVDVAIEGTMHKRGNGQTLVRISVIEAAHGFVLWKGKFERHASEIFDLCAEVSDVVAKTLAVETRQNRRSLGPENRNNADAFLRAKKAHSEWTSDGSALALELLQEVSRIGAKDPLVRSYEALAQLRQWTVEPYVSMQLGAEAQTTAQDVLESNPNLAEAHLALATHALLNANWMRAARGLEEAVRCNQALSDAYGLLGMLYCWTNHTEQGLRMIDVALRIDPKNLQAMWTAAFTYGLIGQPAGAFRCLDRADQAVPNHPITVAHRLRIALWHGDRKALAQAQDSTCADGAPSDTWSLVVRLFVEPEPGHEIRALTAFAASEGAPPALRGWLMQAVAERMVMSGQIQDAWTALRAAAPHSVNVIWFNRCPALARMTRMPAFLTLRSQIGQRASQLFIPTPTPRR